MRVVLGDALKAHERPSGNWVNTVRHARSPSLKGQFGPRLEVNHGNARWIGIEFRTIELKYPGLAVVAFGEPSENFAPVELESNAR